MLAIEDFFAQIEARHHRLFPKKNWIWLFPVDRCWQMDLLHWTRNFFRHERERRRSLERVSEKEREREREREKGKTAMIDI